MPALTSVPTSPSMDGDSITGNLLWERGGISLDISSVCQVPEEARADDNCNIGLAPSPAWAVVLLKLLCEGSAQRCALQRLR